MAACPVAFAQDSGFDFSLEEIHQFIESTDWNEVRRGFEMGLDVLNKT